MNQFIEAHELGALPNDGEKFEHFSAYAILSAKRLTQGSYVDGLTGRGEEGIDFVGIIVNGTLLAAPEDVAAIAEHAQEISAEYVFIQSKISEKFKSGEIQQFTSSVRNFFDFEANIGTSKDILTARAIHSQLMEQASKLRRNPDISAYYVTTGQVPKEHDKNGQIKYLEQLRKDLEKLSLFNSFDIGYKGADEINELYRSATTAVTASINFSEKVTLSEVEGIDQAYLGFLPINELLKLICDDRTDGLRTHIFDDNVRDYQGDGTLANRGMQNTLLSDYSKQFSVMNNGVTIVARSLQVTGNHFTLTDFQIVNGAQTSNVIFNNRASLANSDIRVPVKLIQSNDEDLITRVVLATNSQTPVTTTQLNARAKAERDIEKYFANGETPGQLYYERRKGQYDRDQSVVMARVIDRTVLVRSTASTFGNEPHTATGYQQDILKRLEGAKDTDKRRYLSDDDQAIVYYAAASAYYRLDLYFKSGRIDASYKPGRWHLLHIARRLQLPDGIDDFSDKKIRQPLEDFVNLLWDDEHCENLFANAIKVLDSAKVDITREVLRGIAATQAIEKAIDDYDNRD